MTALLFVVVALAVSAGCKNDEPAPLPKPVASVTKWPPQPTLKPSATASASSDDATGIPSCRHFVAEKALARNGIVASGFHDGFGGSRPWMGIACPVNDHLMFEVEWSAEYQPRKARLERQLQVEASATRTPGAKHEIVFASKQPHAARHVRLFSDPRGRYAIIVTGRSASNVQKLATALVEGASP